MAIEEYPDDPVRIISNNSIIEFSGDKVIVTDIYDIEVDLEGSYRYTRYPTKIELISELNKTMYKPIVMKAVLDNKEIIIEDDVLIQEGVEYKNSIATFETVIWTNRLGIEKSGRRNLEITYSYELNQVLKEYDDICVLKVTPQKSNVKVVLPQNTDNIKILEHGIKLLKENDNSYSFKNNIIRKFFDNEVTLLVDKNVVNGGRMMKGNYTYMSDSLKEIINHKYSWILGLIFVISMSVCISSIVLTLKPRKKVEYVRECENVINPVLAEALIDRKIGPKELIMTCVLSAIKKGALEVIDNDTIEYRTNEFLNKTEKIVVSMIFYDYSKRIKINELKNVFSEDNIETERIYEGFLKIKNNTLAELKNFGIYSENSKIVLRILKFISIIILCNIIPIMLCFLQDGFSKNEVDVSTIFLGINSALIIFGIKLASAEAKNRLPESDTSETGWLLGLMFVCAIILCILGGIFILKENIYAIIIILIISILNFITYRNSKKQVLTKSGKEEYRKVLGLKNYIKDYSIMEKRDMDEVVLWDDYLIYATAFGIPNKVTDKFAEGFLKANINLQKINRLLGFK